MRARLFRLLVIAGLLLIEGPFARAAQTYRLQEVRVVGSQRFREGDLITALGLKIGTTVDLDALKLAADRLMATGVLASLEYKYTPLSTGLQVEYTATDGTDFLPCRYDNIVWMGSEQLTRAVHDKVPLYDGNAPTSGDLLDQVANAISAVLAQHGVVTKVRYELHTRNIGGPIDAISFVSDTVTPKVKEITLTGANLMTAEEKAENTKRLVGDDYNATRIREELITDLFVFYGNKGYLRVQVGEPQAQLTGDPQQGLVAVNVPVSEGAQYRWQGIEWSGNSAITTQALEKLVPVRPGQVADHGRFGLELAAVQRAYKTKGYLAVKLQRVPAFNDQDHTVSYRITVTEGDQFRMGVLHMTGLDPLVLDQLRKKWKLKSGDPYDDAYLAVFLKENAELINGRGQAKSLKVVQSPTADKYVDVTLQF